MSHSKQDQRKRKAREQKKKLARRLNPADAEMSLMRRMSERHVDVLQNIEQAVLSAANGDPQIDDVAIAAALRAGISGDRVSDERASAIAASILAMRSFRADVSDDLWRDGLRVVHDSVKTHSTLAPGARGYLRFASRFVV